ncbi:MAG: hypothetical protein JO033_06190 [Acidobacteriaceae bacterium]|nr:hypothetical protein [Acidobacteriaceae bacterium]
MKDTNLAARVASAGAPLMDSSLNIWRLRSANGNDLWTWIAGAFTSYWILFVTGAFLGRKELNAVGGAVILAVLAWIILERLWVRVDAVVVASLMAAGGIPLLQLIANEPLSSEAVFKHVSLYLVVAASRLLDLPIVCRSKVRWYLALQILTILFVSFTIYRGTSWDGGVRHSGLFVNPNNLALIPFLLLFLIDPLRDKLFIRLAVHAVTVAVLAFSGTSGAVVAYTIGLAVNLRTSIPKRWRTSIYCVIPGAVFVCVAFIAMNGFSLLPDTRLTNQIGVISGQLQTVLSGGNVAYYAQERVLGPGSASGIWRIAHWLKTVTTYFDGTPLEQIIGFGLGSSPTMLGKLPHNEYLRMLFEQGLIGFAIFIFVWRRILMTAPPHVRFVGLIVAIYSFSENNLDNFPFMALFTLCLSARRVRDTAVVQIPCKVLTVLRAATQEG